MSASATRSLTTLGEYVGGRIFRGILTGFNKAFYLNGKQRNEFISLNQNNDDIIQPFATDEDIRKFHLRDVNQWIILTKIGIDMSLHPEIFDHLSQWRAELQARHDQGNHWWELRACSYYNRFQDPKIVYQKFQVKPAFAHDASGALCNDAAYIIAMEDMYLLGVLNSSACWIEISRHCSPIQNGYQLMRSYFERIAIPRAASADRRAIATLTEQRVQRQVEDSQSLEWEAEIDERVAWLYGLKQPPGRPEPDGDDA